MNEQDVFSIDFRFGGNAEFLARLEALMERVDEKFKILDVDVKKNTTALDANGNAAERNSKKVGLLSGAFGHLGQTLLGLGGAFAGFGMIREAVSSFSEMERLQTDISTLLGSDKAGKDFSNYIVDFAKKTPYSISALSSLAKGLIQYNIPLADTKKYMSELGDIALGDQNKMASLGIVLGQVASLGHLQGQDYHQFLNVGFNPLTQLSSMTGKSMGELTTMMSKGQISFQMVADAMKSATSEGGKFYKGMEKGALTLSGLWSSAMDNIRISLGEAVGKNQDKLKDFVKKLGEIDFSKMIDSLSNLGGVAVDVIEKGGDLLGVLTKMPNLIEAVVVALGSYKAMTLLSAAATDGIGLSFDNWKNKTIGLNRELVKMAGAKGAALGAAAGIGLGMTNQSETTMGNLGNLTMALTAGAAAGGLMGAAMAGLAVSITSVVSALSKLYDEKGKESARNTSYQEMGNAEKALRAAKKKYDAGDMSYGDYKATYDTYQRLRSKANPDTAVWNPENSSYNIFKKKELPEGAKSAKSNVTNNYNVNSNNTTQDVKISADLDKIGMLLNANLRALIDRQMKLNIQTSVVTEI